MRSILFTIPLDGRVDLGPFGKVPVFGCGVLLAIWCLIGAGYVWLTVRREGWKGMGLTFGVFWSVIAIALFKAPELNFKSIPIFGYGTMMFLGFVASASLAAWRLRRAGADGEIAWDIAMWVFVAGILGARLFYIVEYHERFFGPDPAGRARPLGDVLVGLVNLTDGGLVLYGGLIFGPLAYYLFCRRRGIRPLALADIVITSVFVGIAFGRLGCLLHGCCFGDVCDLPWAVQFPAGSVPFNALVERGLLSMNAPRSLPLHPTQIYDSLSGLLLALFTLLYYPYRSRTGEVVAVGWLAYPINRFMIEILRSDEGGQFGTNLTIAQWVSLALVLTGAGFMFWLYHKPPQRLPLMLAPQPQPPSAPAISSREKLAPAR